MIDDYAKTKYYQYDILHTVVFVTIATALFYYLRVVF